MYVGMLFQLILSDKIFKFLHNVLDRETKIILVTQKEENTLKPYDTEMSNLALLLAIILFILTLIGK